MDYNYLFLAMYCCIIQLYIAQKAEKNDFPKTFIIFYLLPSGYYNNHLQ